MDLSQLNFKFCNGVTSVVIANQAVSSVSIRGETMIFDLSLPDFSESCCYLQYFLGDGVLYIS